MQQLVYGQSSETPVSQPAIRIFTPSTQSIDRCLYTSVTFEADSVSYQFRIVIIGVKGVVITIILPATMLLALRDMW